jgi:protein-S-isoprenylcysteine O-methyltransferase Ste14
MDDSAGIKFPPPIVYVGGFFAGALLEQHVVRITIGPRQPLAAIGWALGAAAIALMLWGVFTFRRARTAIIPHLPASRLVRHGPYRFTRNPMYVGLTAIYIGLSLLFNVAWPLVLLPAVLALMWVFVIRREEGYLRRAFGEEYDLFTREVRRWL